MTDSIDLSQSELDKLLSQRKPHEPTEREKIQAKVHDKFQGLVTQSHIDEMMGVKPSQDETVNKQEEFTGAISQEELDRLFKK